VAGGAPPGGGVEVDVMDEGNPHRDVLAMTEMLMATLDESAPLRFVAR
jgi:hypothetical protein